MGIFNFQFMFQEFQERLLCDANKDQVIPADVLLKPELQAYLAACMKLCLLMSASDPPVVLYCPTREACDSKTGSQQIQKKPDKLLLDKERFKQYTQSGKYVEFVVWPAMYLHVGGPILSKGVAQGTWN